MHNRLSLISLTGALVAAATLSACSSTQKPLYADEQFDASSSPYTHTFHEHSTASCEAARRALLSQGYITNLTRPDTVDGSKNFQPNNDTHVTIEFHVVCVDADSDATSSIAYVNAVQDRYTLKKATTSASVGLSVLGSVSLPIGSSDDSMVKIASETIPAGVFYDRFFKLVDHFLKIDPARHGKAAAKAAEKEPVAPLPEPAAVSTPGTPGEDAPVKLKTPVATPAPSLPPGANATPAAPLAPVTPAASVVTPGAAGAVATSGALAQVATPQPSSAAAATPGSAAQHDQDSLAHALAAATPASVPAVAATGTSASAGAIQAGTLANPAPAMPIAPASATATATDTRPAASAGGHVDAVHGVTGASPASASTAANPAPTPAAASEPAASPAPSQAAAASPASATMAASDVAPANTIATSATSAAHASKAAASAAASAAATPASASAPTAASGTPAAAASAASAPVASSAPVPASVASASQAGTAAALAP
ncbi:MAG: hypothetical protein GAK40_00728 [Burkholderia plantarii]|nr:MAG: hypothetical protein GAK40_00728 [Burkholderia plantarii]